MPHCYTVTALCIGLLWGEALVFEVGYHPRKKNSHKYTFRNV